MLDKAPNQPSKFKTKNWFKINDDSWRVYNTTSQIKFQTSMLSSSLFDYSVAYILVKGTLSVPNMSDAGAVANNRNAS